MSAHAASTPSEWPDWSDRPCAIVASGPSAKQANLELLRGKFAVLAIKKSLDLCPWADAVYGCDYAWWAYKGGLPEFSGLKLAWAELACARFPDIRQVHIETSQDGVYPVELRRYHMTFDQTGYVGNGGNSGYQALNLTAQFGAKRILLVGFDLIGTHWYGRNDWLNAGNPEDSNFRRWRIAFDAAAPILAERGIDVVNASPSSVLSCFRRATVEETVAAWT